MGLMLTQEIFIFSHLLYFNANKQSLNEELTINLLQRILCFVWDMYCRILQMPFGVLTLAFVWILRTWLPYIVPQFVVSEDKEQNKCHLHHVKRRPSKCMNLDLFTSIAFFIVAK